MTALGAGQRRQSVPSASMSPNAGGRGNAGANYISFTSPPRRRANQSLRPQGEGPRPAPPLCHPYRFPALRHAMADQTPAPCLPVQALAEPDRIRSRFESSLVPHCYATGAIDRPGLLTLGAGLLNGDSCLIAPSHPPQGRSSSVDIPFLCLLCLPCEAAKKRRPMPPQRQHTILHQL